MCGFNTAWLIKLWSMATPIKLIYFYFYFGRLVEFLGQKIRATTN